MLFTWKTLLGKKPRVAEPQKAMHYKTEDYKELTRPLTQLKLNLRNCEVLVDNSPFTFHVLAWNPHWMPLQGAWKKEEKE